MLRIVKCALCAAMLWMALPAWPADSDSVDACARDLPPPRLALVLSGGGARGAAHIGVLKVLEREQIPVDLVVGTSMGSIVGGLYASGMSAAEIEAYFLQAPWNAYLQDEVPRTHLALRRKREDLNFVTGIRLGVRRDGIVLPRGLRAAQLFQTDLREKFFPVRAIECFDDYPLPLRVVAARIEDGKETVFDRGDPVAAIRASMAIPGILSPAEIDGSIYVDGGVANNLPVDLALASGAQHILAIDISTPPRKQEDIENMLDVANQMTALLTWRNIARQREQLRAQDILLEPELHDIGTFDLRAIRAAIQRGEAAAEAQLDALRAFRVSHDEWQAWRARFHDANAAPLVLGDIVLQSDSRYPEELLHYRLNLPTGEAVTYDAIKTAMQDVYGLDVFESVDHRLQPMPDAEDGSAREQLQVSTRRKSHGPNYVQIGLEAEDHFQGENRYELGLSFLVTEMPNVNGEWASEVRLGEDVRVASELAIYSRRWPSFFVAPAVRFERNVIHLYNNDGEEVARISDNFRAGSFSVGREFEDSMEWRVGSETFDGEEKPESGLLTALLPFHISYRTTENYFAMTADTLDQVDFPTRGYTAEFRYAFSRADFHSDADYNTHEGSFAVFHEWKRQVYSLGGQWGATLSRSNVTNARLHQLGGFLQLSGLNRDELYGERMGLLRFVTYHRYRIEALMPLYLGGSVELGNVWDSNDDISADTALTAGSVFVGSETFFGPMYLGSGFVEGGRHSLFFYLGRTF